MEIRVYDKQNKISIILPINSITTLTELAHQIGYCFYLDMFGHTFEFCNSLRGNKKYLSYEDEEYFDTIDESETVKSTKTLCSIAFKNIGDKLLFVQDLGDCNEFILTRKK